MRIFFFNRRTFHPGVIRQVDANESTQNYKTRRIVTMVSSVGIYIAIGMDISFWQVRYW